MEEFSREFYAVYLQSEEWKAKVHDAKRRAAYRCQICNRHEDDVILDGHHRTYERFGREFPEDITILCRDCHELYSNHKQLAKYGKPELLQISRVKSPGGIAGASLGLAIPTGFADVDVILGGFQRGDLIVIAARPSMGKTSFLLSTSLNVVHKYGRKVAVVSLQMSSEQVVRRLISQLTGIDNHRLQLGEVYENEWDSFAKATTELSELPLYVEDTPALSPFALRTICLNLQATHGLDLVAVDGMELMEQERFGDIACKLKNLARELDVPILLTATVDHDCEKRSDKHPVLSDLPRYSGLEEISDVVMFIYRDEMYDQQTERKNVAEIIVAKHHNGPNGQVELFFRNNLAQFANVAKREIQV